MTDGDWHNTDRKSFGMLLADTLHHMPCEQAMAHEHDDDAILVIVNAHTYEIDFKLPQLQGHWQVLIETAPQQRENTQPTVTAQGAITVFGRSMLILSYNHNHIEELKEKKTP